MEAYVGDWVEIEKVLLEAGSRAPQVPEDTQNVPLKEWSKGFLLSNSAILGDTVEIETIIGRKLKGKLSDIRPKYNYDYGYPVKELIYVGVELRKELKEILEGCSCERFII